MQPAGAVALPPEVIASYVAEGLWDDAGLRIGIEAWAQRTPDRVALVEDDRAWTYAELDAAVARAVTRLTEFGLDANRGVLVIAPLHALSVVAYHAVLRAGGVAVMLDRRCGRADVTAALAAGDIAAVVAPPHLIEALTLADLGRPVLTFDELVAPSEEFRGWVEPDPRRGCAVVFTSGTTSRPKAVVHCLNTIRAGARNMAGSLQVTADDAAFLSTPIASITGLVQAHLTLDRGATLILEDQFEPARSLDRLIRHGATILGGAPVILEQLIDEARRRDLHDLPLRALALGGAMIPRPLLELALARYRVTPVRMYGSSEIPCATYTLVSDVGEARLRDDGACAPGTQLSIDDATGELLVRGPSRFLGYLDEQDNRAALADGGWFRTGDVGRIEAGRLTVTGRLKEVVARKGLKISLAEIDEVVASLPGVEEAAAFGVPDAETGERLAIAIRVVDADAVDFDAVVNHCLAAGLAKWKLPEQVDVWESPLPRTASGKIQRRYLANAAACRRRLLAPRLRRDEPV